MYDLYDSLSVTKQLTKQPIEFQLCVVQMSKGLVTSKKPVYLVSFAGKNGDALPMELVGCRTC